MSDHSKDQPTLTLNDGRSMPQLGYGTFEIPDEDAPGLVGTALGVGYWLVDTAALYENERGVGKGIGEWSDIFLTTKIWNDDQGFDEAKRAFSQSLERLDRAYVDLLLIHWPCPDKGKFVDTWKALIALREEDTAKSIGVSNFRITDLEKLEAETGVRPAVNQIELHPYFQQAELRAVHDEMGIATQCWSPLGQGDALDDPVIKDIASAHGVQPAAVILAWQIQLGCATIPKSSSREHMEGNFKALDVSLTEEDMARIAELDRADGRIGPDPAELC
ncbi:aldo/keto reductase [Paraurantiacibacter namhicola]|uniref:Putative oxidoreductase n=1 Tax=Paraurantiacibacter namhicola TaxID=645517 RepID=A0A1C7D7G0_9SPHN|nr:aldo/keto reductase [Paraurantiacibacter namhicola]ANU07388.1 putative oxidoreductase [Paraurantiacibacter namhicola]